MNCNCIERINAKLKDAGHNYQLAPSLVFDDKMQLETLLSVSTAWVGEPPRGKETQVAACNDLHLLSVLSPEDRRE